MIEIKLTYDKIIEKVMVSPGFSTDISLNHEELDYLREKITKQWLEVFLEEVPCNAKEIRDAGIIKYHEVSYLIDHNKVWNKSNRCLSQDVVIEIESMPFFKKLLKIFGDFNISDVAYDGEVIKGSKEVYWRLVRPGVSSDVGTLHADKWFHEILDFKSKIFNEKTYTLKVWIPIFCEPGKNGLLIVPNSHSRDWKYSSKLVEGIPKLIFEDKADPVLIETPPGNMIIFNESILHGGAINMGNETRVSMEITMCFE